MKKREMFGILAAFLFFIVVLSIQTSQSANETYALTPLPTYTISNGILDVTVLAIQNMSGVGTFTIGTGQYHPNPGLNVLFGHPIPRTTYTTIQVVDNKTEYVTSEMSDIAASPGYTLKRLDQYVSSVNPETSNITVIWITSGNLVISQITEVAGTSISDTWVKVSLKVTNHDNVPHGIGIRYEWDIKIADRDGSYVRPWTNMTTPQTWLDKETVWDSPDFQFWEATDDVANPLFSIYGSVTQPEEVPVQPTKPDKLVLANWNTSSFKAYDYNTTGLGIAGSNSDSAMLYYWNPATLEPGASREVTAYITTRAQARGTWAPHAESALVASAVTVGITSGVSAIASAVASPESCPSNKLAEKANDILPDSIKKWLDSFICSKTGASIEHRVGFVWLFTKQEIVSMAISLIVITFAFSYAKAESLNQILFIVPIVLASSILVDLVKDLSRELLARHLGVWSEYRLWYFGLAMLLISSIVFRAPFSSPNRIRHHSPKLTNQAVGLLSLLPVVISLLFAALFYMLFTNGFALIGNMGLIICLTAAFFDAIPIPPMNGKDIYDWNKFLWLLVFIACFALYALCLLVL